MRALPVDPTATMRELDFPSLHKVYAKWRGRVPAVRPRRVHSAADLPVDEVEPTAVRGELVDPRLT